jgi:hypothetical protein
MTMAQFTDAHGRLWPVRIDVSTVRRVRAATGVDLARVLTTAEGVSALHGDVCLFVDVLWEIVRPVAEATHKLDAEQFGQSLLGDALGDAIRAFEDAVVEFLPESESRQLVSKVIEGGRALAAQSRLRISNALRSGLIETGIRRELERLDHDLASMNGTLQTTGFGS